MSSNLKAQLKSLIAAKEYRAAIVLLEGSTLPDKATYIQRIKARIDEDAHTADDTLKAHIAAGEYRQARDFLRGVEHPKKAVMLAELERRIEAAEKPPPPMRLSPGMKRLLVLVMVVLSLMCGVQTHTLYRANQEAGRSLTLQFDVERVCRDVYLDNGYTAHQLVYGCEQAAAQSIKLYTEEIDYCYDNQHETDARFMKCLADNGVKISDLFLARTPKE